MTKPPKPSEDDEICLMCRRPKSRHTHEEMLACSRKMKEFQKEKKWWCWNCMNWVLLTVRIR